MSKQKRRSGPGKPQGVTYAQVLARQAAATVQAQADAHTQRAMWLMGYSISDAYGYGPKGMQKFFAALQENTEELERMRTEVDEEYAFEKLRQKASRVTGMEVHYLEDQLGVLKEMRETQQMTPFS